MTFRFEYPGKLTSILKQNLGSESGDQVGSVDEKKTEVEHLVQVYLKHCTIISVFPNFQAGIDPSPKKKENLTHLKTFCEDDSFLFLFLSVCSVLHDYETVIPARRREPQCGAVKTASECLQTTRDQLYSSEVASQGLFPMSKTTKQKNMYAYIELWPLKTSDYSLMYSSRCSPCPG